MKKYIDLPEYLLRWTLFRVGAFHVRMHNIITGDNTPFLHNHPFNYMSVVISGGYSEQVLIDDSIVVKHHRVGSVILRNSSTYHRIKEVLPGCKTIFFAFGSALWCLKRHKDVVCPAEYKVPVAPGVYRRELSGCSRYARFDGFWRVSSNSIYEAMMQVRPSIHQVGHWEEI